MWWLRRSLNHHICGSLLRARRIFITLLGQAIHSGRRVAGGESLPVLFFLGPRNDIGGRVTPALRVLCGGLKDRRVPEANP